MPIAGDQDVERAIALCEKVADAMNNDAAWRTRLLDPVEVWGIEALSVHEVQVRLVVRANPGPDAGEAARELRRRILTSFAAARLRVAAQRDITIQPVTAAERPGAPSSPGDINPAATSQS